MNEQPLVSVVITNYQKGDLLFSAIQSILNQDYNCIELIVIDDASSDFDEMKVQQFIEGNKKENIVNAVILRNKVNAGTVKSLNTAIAQCTGRYIKLLDGDDWYPGDAVRTSVDFMEKNPAWWIGIGDAEQYSWDWDTNKGSLITSPPNDIARILSLNPSELYVHMVHNGLISTINACIFKKEYFEEYGEFDERYRLYQDRPMFLRMAIDGVKLGYISQSVYCTRLDMGVSSTGNIDLIKDGLQLILCDYWQHVDLLGEKFCRRAQSFQELIIKLRTDFPAMPMKEKMLFCFRNLGGLIRIVRKFGVKGCLLRLKKYT